MSVVKLETEISLGRLNQGIPRGIVRGHTDLAEVCRLLAVGCWQARRFEISLIQDTIDEGACLLRPVAEGKSTVKAGVLRQLVL